MCLLHVLRPRINLKNSVWFEKISLTVGLCWFRNVTYVKYPDVPVRIHLARLIKPLAMFIILIDLRPIDDLDRYVE